MAFLKNFLQQKGVRQSSVVSRMVSQGMPAQRAEDAAQQFADVAQKMQEYGVAASAIVRGIWVPGRIEVLGKHTDYAGGCSLLVASSCGFAVLVAASKRGGFTLLDAGREQNCNLSAEGEAMGDLPAWALYPQTAIQRLQANFAIGESSGVIGFSSNLPRAAGMSSSSAFITATSLAVMHLARIESLPAYREAINGKTDFADYLGHIENGKSYKQLLGHHGVGTLGGSQDHTAIVCAKPRHLLHAGFQPTNIFGYSALPEKLVFCIGVSGVRAKKTGAVQTAYNNAAQRVMAILEWWQAASGRRVPTLAAMIADEDFVLNDAIEALSVRSPHLAGRLLQFVNETTTYIPGALEAIRTSNMALLNNCVAGSQRDADEKLGNQVEETVALASMAKRLGAVAASAFGAGFGGAVWSLVMREDVSTFMSAWERGYSAAFPERDEASFFVDETGPAAFQL